MATIQDKNGKTTRVDSNGYLYNDAQSEPVGRIHGGGIYDQDGKLTARYQGGKIYDLDGPWGGTVTGHYENGKIYDQNGSWGGNVTGHYDGNVFDEDGGLDPYHPPSDGSSPAPDHERPPASLPQQERAPEVREEKEEPRPLVRPQVGKEKGLSFLMSKCRLCGAPAKGKYYKLLLILTPFALLFYALIISLVVSIAFTNQSGTNIVVNLIASTIASIITISIFLIPGLAILYLLRRPKAVCGACGQGK